MTIIIAVIVGFILGSIPKDGLNDIIVRTYTKLHEYLRSPSTDKLDLDWSTRQIIRVFNTNASERWYESRVHLKNGVLKSLACTLHLIYVVRISFIDEDMCSGKSKVFTVHGFQSLKSVMVYIEKQCAVFYEEINKDENKKLEYYQSFVAGHNVVHDYISGSLV